MQNHFLAINLQHKLLTIQDTTVDKIEIKNRLTGQIEASYDTAVYCMTRRRAKVKARKIRKLSEDEVDALLSELLAGGRGGKRVPAAKAVLTQHITSTEAARQVGIAVPGVSDLVKQLEKLFKSKQEAFLSGQHDNSVRAKTPPTDNLEDLFG